MIQNNFKHNKDLFSKKGYFVVRNLIKKNIIKKLLVEIYKAKNTDRYSDSKGNLRRIERLYDKGKTLNDLNLKILSVLKKVFAEKFVIFNPWILDTFRVRSENVMGYLLTHDSLGTMRKQPD